MSQVTRIALVSSCFAIAACQSDPQMSSRSRTATSQDASAQTNEDANQTGIDQGVSNNSADAMTMLPSDSGVALDANMFADAQTGSSDSGVLFGSRPSTPLSVPTFMALNSDGASRTQGDLIGFPTVVWFFPFAGTPG